TGDWRRSRGAGGRERFFVFSQSQITNHQSPVTFQELRIIVTLNVVFLRNRDYYSHAFHSTRLKYQ
ncbi:hypothetical protein, partial [Sphaerospermopsis sp. LEGE 08334]|uniref:hypothetical protein n=1 Tax=Sphaerospermopsis sp. LEGE 08334 TaxID=1828651 RepID=UPI001D144A69